MEYFPLKNGYWGGREYSCKNRSNVITQICMQKKKKFGGVCDPPVMSRSIKAILVLQRILAIYFGVNNLFNNSPI